MASNEKRNKTGRKRVLSPRISMLGMNNQIDYFHMIRESKPKLLCFII